MKLAAWVALVVLGSTASASWRTDRVNYLDKPHVEASIGVQMGTFLVNGESSALGVSGHLDAGLRYGRWLFYGDYGLYDTSEPPPEDGVSARGPDDMRRAGIMHRFGANTRFAVMRSSNYDSALELYVEGGLGVQHFRWDAGGVWTRRDLAFGVGVSMLSADDDHHLGATLGVRVLLSGRNDVTGDEPRICGGPCDEATGPTTIDRSIMFGLTIHFGT
jgi:hypothetical protein